MGQPLCSSEIATTPSVQFIRVSIQVFSEGLIFVSFLPGGFSLSLASESPSSQCPTLHKPWVLPPSRAPTQAPLSTACSYNPPRETLLSWLSITVSQAVGRPLIGLASDRFGRLNVAGISTLAASISTLLIWTLAGKSFAGTIVYTLFGAFASNMWTTVAPVAAEVVGLQTLPSGEHHGSAFLPGTRLTCLISFINFLDSSRVADNIRRTDCGILENRGHQCLSWGSAICRIHVPGRIHFKYECHYTPKRCIDTNRELVWLLRAYIFQQTTQTSSHREDSRSLNQTGYKERLEILYHRSFTLEKI